MKKFKKLLAAIMTLIMVATALPMTVFAGDASTAEWDGTADTTWYDPENPMTKYTLTTAEQLAGLAELVSGDVTFDGVTITLAKDMNLYCKDTSANADGDPVTFRPIGDHSKNGTFEGIFDGAGHTIKNLYQNGWDLGYEWGVYGSYGLFGNLNDATIKNLTISGAESYIEGGDVGGITGSATGTCLFENITIEDSVFATYNNGCGGIIAWSGAGNYTFKNIKIANDVVLAGLWGSFDSSIGGVVGQAEPGATYNFENVDIACRLDAYNDCTASYDYYNYRMCGMIMGRLEETTTINGRNYPDLSKYNISMDDVTVEFGSWYDYHYCEPTPGLNGGRGMRVEPGYSYDGLPADYDHSQCVDNHMNSIPFEQLFGGAQNGVKGMTEAILKIANEDLDEDLAAEVTVKYGATTEVKGSNSIVTVNDAIESLTKDAVEAALNSGETKRDLSIIAGDIADKVINATVINEARGKLGIAPTDKVTIVMEHYLVVEVTSITTKAETGVVEMELNITPKYDLIATTDPDNIKTEGNDRNAVVIATEKMKVEKGEVVTITVPVPEDFNGDTLYVRHVKSADEVYVYEATVTGTDASRVATFKNPNGFSTFVLTTTAPVAKIGEVGYTSLAAAVAAVADNQTIVLLSDCSANVTVSRDVTFTLDVNGKDFTGSIDPGANTTRTIDGNKYTFDYTAKPKKYSVIIKSAENGNVKADDDRANYSQKITITVTPDKGYKLDEMTITDAKDNKVDYEKGKKENTFVFDMPKADVTIKASFEKESSKVEDEADKEEVKEEVVVEETTLILTIGQVIYQLNGAYEVNDVAPIIKAERTFLPIRLVAEALGATVTWNEADQAVTIAKDGTTIVIYIGQEFALVNGAPVQLDAPAFIANDRTYLPVRFVAENLGATVTWNAAAQTVTIVG